MPGAFTDVVARRHTENVMVGLFFRHIFRYFSDDNHHFPLIVRISGILRDHQFVAMGNQRAGKLGEQGWRSITGRGQMRPVIHADGENLSRFGGDQDTDIGQFNAPPGLYRRIENIAAQFPDIVSDESAEGYFTVMGVPEEFLDFIRGR